MSPSQQRPERSIGISDAIWSALRKMADDMQIEREILINQALFAFAKVNGYDPVSPKAVPVSAPTPVIPDDHDDIEEDDEPQQQLPTPIPAKPPSLPPVISPPSIAKKPTPPMDENTPATGTPALQVSLPQSVAPAMNLGATMPPAMNMGVTMPPSISPVAPPVMPVSAALPPLAMPVAPPVATDIGSKLSIEEMRAAQERVLQKAAELERLVRGGAAEAPAVDDGLLGAERTPAGPAPKSSGPQTLVMYSENREPDRIQNQRFLIGRGKHCDFVINSGKVSREHAAIQRDGDDFYIEDLGSANGTWYDKKRVQRRKIDDGDEFFICSDKVVFRIE